MRRRGIAAVAWRIGQSAGVRVDGHGQPRQQQAIVMQAANNGSRQCSQHALYRAKVRATPAGSWDSGRSDVAESRGWTTESRPARVSVGRSPRRCAAIRSGSATTTMTIAGARSGARSISGWATGQDQFRLTRGEPKSFSKTRGVVRTFCPECGTSISYLDEGLGDELYLTIGFLDQAGTVPPAGARLLADEVALDRIRRRPPARRRLLQEARPGLR